jgi:hypothetical protein
MAYERLSRALALGIVGVTQADKLPNQSQAATTPNFIFLSFQITFVRQPL